MLQNFFHYHNTRIFLLDFQIVDLINISITLATRIDNFHSFNNGEKNHTLEAFRKLKLLYGIRRSEV